MKNADRRTVKLSIVALALAGIGFGAVAEPLSVDWPVQRKHICAFGWEWGNASPEQLLKVADQLADNGISGISVYVSVKGKDGRGYRSSQVIDGLEFSDELLAPKVEPMKAALAKPGLRHSFIRTLGAPQKRVDWSDDAHWAKVTASMGALARFAKRTGAVGFIVDPEDYHNQNQFETKKGDKPYDVLAPLARQRGRELFAAVFAEYPDLKVIGYWLWAWHTKHVYSHNPMQSCRQSGDLWPAFLNGILDVMPPEACLIEGNEWAYQAESSLNDFMISATSQRNSVLGLVAPENRAKFRAQVRTGFGIYMDSYTGQRLGKNGKANPYYFGPVNDSRLGHLERNLGEALDCADEYVWLWHETYEFAKWGDIKPLGWHMKRETWESQLPGLHAMFRATVDPEAFLRLDADRLKEEGKIVSVFQKLDFKDYTQKALDGFTSPDEMQGKNYFVLGDDAARPGMHYLVEIQGHGAGLEPSVHWQLRSQEGNPWRWRIPGHGIALETTADGKRTGRAVVRVPEGVDAIRIMFQLRPDVDEKSGYDSAFLGRINY